MSVVAKFRCESKSTDGSTITLRAVYDPNPDSENGRFFSATPSGTISLNIVNKLAAEQFRVGTEYLVTFNEAPVPELATN